MLINIFIGYQQSFSQEIYTIYKIYKTLPPRYAVKDIEGDIVDSKEYYIF